ncbi:MAG: hypothetical protein NC209_03580 [Alistipes sp.]|nr:hypothetical protein [Alistipes senegalensis]MCM1250211.1 hypothetical protein [Alistipes sp.]
MSVSHSSASDRRRLWRGLCFWAVAGVVLLLGLAIAHGLWLNRRFETLGVETTGVVTRVYTKTEYRTERVTRRTSRRVKTTVHYLDYRFSVGDRSFEHSQRLGQGFVRVRSGDSIGIVYLPDDPAQSRPARDGEGNLRIRRMRVRSRHR